MVQVYDNFIPVGYQKVILNLLSDTAFLWHYQESTVSPNGKKEIQVGPPYNDMCVFTHVIKKGQQEDQCFHELEPLVYFFEDKTGFKVKNIVRIVANLTAPDLSNHLGLPHVDAYTSSAAKIKTLLYYVNNADGETCVFNEKHTTGPLTSPTLYKKVMPKQGRAIVFDSDQYHCNTSSTLDRRMVINLILEVE